MNCHYVSLGWLEFHFDPLGKFESENKFLLETSKQEERSNKKHSLLKEA